MPKPKPIGQRYKVGDRVYRKSPDLRADNSSFNARYGTITGVDSSPNAVGAVNYYYMVRWEGSSTNLPLNICKPGCYQRRIKLWDYLYQFTET